MPDFNQTNWQIEPIHGSRPFRPGEIVMDSWEIVRKIGAGGYGTVYEVRKNLYGVDTRSALKVIPIPHEADYMDSLRSIGSSDTQIQAELRNQVNRGVAEVQAMRRLVDHPAVVRCEDFSVVQYEDDGSWEIFIRMELLTPLTFWLDSHPITEEWVREIGVTIADLLEYCGKQRILHRDIKPGNLFMNSMDKCKLGDFGLARTLSAGSSTHSHGVGTDAFMAPEVAANKHYDQRADIYSLGLVLYWMLNNRNLPFMDSNISYTQAVMTRLSGKPLPRIPGVEGGLMDTVLRACASNPEDRFSTGEEMKKALSEKHLPSSSGLTKTNLQTSHTLTENKEEVPITNKPKQLPKAQVTIVHKTTNGTVLSKNNVEIIAGQSRLFSAQSYKGYKLTSDYASVTVTVDQSGIASNKQVEFIYKKSKRAAIVLIAIIASLAFIALVAWGISNSSNSDVEITFTGQKEQGATTEKTATKDPLISVAEDPEEITGTIPIEIGTYGDYAYEYDPNTSDLTITGYNGSGGDVTIPDRINGYPVTSIGDSVFAYCDGLTAVTISSNVTSIGDYAFYSCTKLTTITIPNSVTSIGKGVFSGCYQLLSFDISNNHPVFEQIDGVLIQRKDKRLVCYPAGKTNTSYTIPKSVMSIGDYAFCGCTRLTTITIPKSVTSIGEAVFAYCNRLSTVTIPNSVTSIGNYALYGCAGMTTITIPNSVTSIGDEAFVGCTGLTTLTIPNSVTSIGDYALWGCSGLTTITIPNSVTSIGEDAFSGADNLIILCDGNSNAAEYCRKNNIPYRTN